MAAASHVLEVSDLHVAYGAIKAIRGVRFHVAQGETVAIIGANGAGKSTLMRALSGVMPIEAGSATFQGTPIAGLGAHTLARRGMLHVPEGRGTIRMMTVWENLRLAWEIRPTDVPFDRALQSVYARFPRLQERTGQFAGDLSGGEQQMLSLARAIINRPQVLLVDEPSLGLSPLLTREVFRVLTEFRDAGGTILIVEQNVRSALTLAHRGYVLAHGRLSGGGPSDELLRDPDIISTYLGGGRH